MASGVDFKCNKERGVHSIVTIGHASSATVDSIVSRKYAVSLPALWVEYTRAISGLVSIRIEASSVITGTTLEKIREAGWSGWLGSALKK